MRQVSSLKHGRLISRSTTEAAITHKSELDGKVVAGILPHQEPDVFAIEQTRQELEAPQFDTPASESLVPHKVITISYARSRAEEPSLGRGTNFDLVFLCGALAAALLVAGGLFQVVSRSYRIPMPRRHYPPPYQPGAGLAQQKVSSRRPRHRRFLSLRTSRQATKANDPIVVADALT